MSRRLMIISTAIVVIVIVAIVFSTWIRSPQSQTPDETKTFPTNATPPTGAQATAAAGAIPTGPHPAPKEITFHGCPPGGDGTDTELNAMKNRVDPVANPAPVKLADILALPWPAAVSRKHMANWPADARDQVMKYDGVGVVTDGYFLRVTPEGAESTNCHATDAANVDFHEWIAPQSSDSRVQAVVVEITPRLRETHPGWTVSAFQQLAKTHARVRITGWLMLDPEHPDQIGNTRGTIWEIHPVTKVEVFQNGQWLDLDRLKGEIDGRQAA